MTCCEGAEGADTSCVWRVYWAHAANASSTGDPQRMRETEGLIPACAQPRHAKPTLITKETAWHPLKEDSLDLNGDSCQARTELAAQTGPGPELTRSSALGLVLSQPFSVQPNGRFEKVTNQGCIAGLCLTPANDC
ncbi:hypothetical protein JZ751_022235 [Albula glossodonta]|uniref:Uncharacterized protein n=1 Tax=Albula glossodonta TaxID=121402 RepID=A0A8T2NQM7_9TELE|nr:hypothetical protein JZ751_022235 [Albula glossodonta]